MLAQRTAALALLIAIGCDAPVTATDAGADAGPDGATLIAEGEALFWRTLSGEVELRRTAIATLERGLELEPDHPRGNLIHAMALLSAIAEDMDFRYAADLEPAFVRAIETNPDDPRIPGWYGTVRVAMARALGDDAALAEAIDYMIAAADQWPDFNNFSLAIAFIGLPLDTPYPAMALDRLEAIADCGERTDVCRNDNVPHNVEGSLMTFGDVHARLGDVERARSYYSMALAQPTAAEWAYRDDAQALLDSVEERAALWTNADPADDPLLFSAGRTSCVGCHAR